MSRKPTAKDFHMLSDIRLRLVAAMLDLGFPVKGAPVKGAVDNRVVECNHGVEWTTCTVCSKPRAHR